MKKILFLAALLISTNLMASDGPDTIFRNAIKHFENQEWELYYRQLSSESQWELEKNLKLNADKLHKEFPELDKLKLAKIVKGNGKAFFKAYMNYFINKTTLQNRDFYKIIQIFPIHIGLQYYKEYKIVSKKINRHNAHLLIEFTGWTDEKPVQETIAIQKNKKKWKVDLIETQQLRSQK